MANTNPARGMRDFLPSDVRKREYVINIIKEVYESYGFEPLETPSVENLETLTGKYGEEGNQLIFKILKRGEKLQEELSEGKIKSENELSDLALRYDLTVPLARVVANRKNDLPKFFKRYQIQPVWRADRPAKGRFREFYQCDVDAIGSSSMMVEAELCAAVSEILTRLGFNNFVIRVNHRKILTGILEAADVPIEKYSDALTALDKLDKIGREGVTKEFLQRGIIQSSAEKLLIFFESLIESNIQNVIGKSQTKKIIDVQKRIDEVEKAIIKEDEEFESKYNVKDAVSKAMESFVNAENTEKGELIKKAGVETIVVAKYIEQIAIQKKNLDILMTLLDFIAKNTSGDENTENDGITALGEFLQAFETVGPQEITLVESPAEKILIDPSLARGLSYYTGAIFEINVPDLAGSLGGGGRYDGLIGMFGKEQIPACGFSLGLERILFVMEERGMFQKLVDEGKLKLDSADVLVTVWNEESIGESLKLAAELRKENLRVLVYPEADKLGKQFKYAGQIGVPFVCVLGEAELAENTVTLKNMQTGAQETVARRQIAEKIK